GMTGWCSAWAGPRMFTNVRSDGGDSRHDVGDGFEQRGESRGGFGLRIGIAALLPRQREALGIEPGEQPSQQLVARHAPLGDQLAIAIDLLDAAVDRAVEGDWRKAADSQLR